ncbi:MAG TPA: hypothetical protein PK430_06620 [Muribaculum sp.]|jgi:hypothetical protein|uniref:Uncharacterized protein n=1 Tax=Heminiphilus faecis TaxID=2601703 RepID=A0ABV4CUZ6_9BACT|nr:hypothetical protein [Heminiphilus faecis]RLT77842.1 hypothetical protein D7V95_00960 [bacterium J10(2018)]DAT44900.1 MAG TPA: hypothetical protein [Caudoviricetes sp.]HRF68882.1 hypothetical protein [Muribaculum sp.]
MNSSHQEVAIVLDYSDMARDIYAASALHSYLSPEDKPLPPMIVPDNEQALVPALKSAFIFTSLNMLPLIADIDLNDDHGINLTLKVNTDTARRKLDLLRHTLRDAVVAYAMHTCCLGIDDTMSQRYRATALSAVAALNMLCSTPAVIRINPHR